MRSGSPDLSERVRRYISNPQVPLWFPDLAHLLASHAWDRLSERCSISKDEYGTHRVIFGSATASRSISFSIREAAGPGNILVEDLAEEAWQQIGKSVTPFKMNSAEAPVGRQILDEAISAMEKVRSLYGTVFEVVRSLHPIRSDEDCEYDISFSEPHIPFSIFISVPHKRCPAGFLRVAEGIVHEAMHLHLTLIDNVAPLTTGESEEFYSPWRDEYRSAYGVLHGLYVFGVLREFYRELLSGGCFPEQRAFIVDRIETITSEIDKVKTLETSRAITELAQALVRRIQTSREIHRGSPSPSS